MGVKENKKKNDILLNLKPNERLFRINAGMGWTAPPKRTAIKRESDGSTTVIMKNAFPFHGAPKGWPDLCGWETVEITPDMVGQRVAVFRFDEIKQTGRLSKEQSLMIDALRSMGGFANVHYPD
jgi:hypothetical protein